MSSRRSTHHTKPKTASTRHHRGDTALYYVQKQSKSSTKKPVRVKEPGSSSNAAKVYASHEFSTGTGSMFVTETPRGRTGRTVRVTKVPGLPGTHAVEGPLHVKRHRTAKTSRLHTTKTVPTKRARTTHRQYSWTVSVRGSSSSRVGGINAASGRGAVARYVKANQDIISPGAYLTATSGRNSDTYEYMGMNRGGLPVVRRV